MDSSRGKEVESEYLSSLMDLNVNSKPLINMLTMLAEDNMDFASVIVHAIEKHITQVVSLEFLCFHFHHLDASHS